METSLFNLSLSPADQETYAVDKVATRKEKIFNAEKEFQKVFSNKNYKLVGTGSVWMFVSDTRTSY